MIVVLVMIVAWPRPSRKVDVARLPYYVKELSTPNWPLWRWKLCSFLRRKPLPNINVRTPDQRRNRAADAIIVLGEKARPATGSILPLLFNQDTSSEAMRALLGIGVTAEILPQLSRATTNQSLNVRLSSTVLLSALVPTSPEAVSLVVGMLNDPDYHVRLLAVHALENVQGDPSGAALGLVERLNDRDANVRRDAAGVLSIYGNRATNALPALRKVLETQRGEEKKFLETLVLVNMLSTNPPVPYFRPSVSAGTNLPPRKIDYE